MTLLLALLTMSERDYFPEIYDEGIKYICDDYDSQGFGGNVHESSLFCFEIFNQLIKADSDIDDY